MTLFLTLPHPASSLSTGGITCLARSRRGAAAGRRRRTAGGPVGTDSLLQPPQDRDPRAAARALRLRFLKASAFFVAFLLLYRSSSALLGRNISPATAYFQLLADAFLRGEAFLTNPPAVLDLIDWNGRWYLPFPPLPAVLLLPWVAISGAQSVNTVFFANGLGALNVALVFVLLDTLRTHSRLEISAPTPVLLTIFFGAGTVHWYVSTLGSVWYVSQLCTVTFLLLAAMAAFRRSFIVAGTLLALSMLCRPHVVLSLPLLLALGALAKSDGKIGEGVSLRDIVRLIVPLGVGAALLATYNGVRFGTPFDFQYTKANAAPALLADLREFGQFSLHYLQRNLSVLLFGLPEWNTRHRLLLPRIEGMSIFLTSPALLCMFRGATGQALRKGAWLALLLTLIPLVTYYNTGWYQFGYRFSLDLSVAVLILLETSAAARRPWTLTWLLIASVLVNAWGVWWFANPRFFVAAV